MLAAARSEGLVKIRIDKRSAPRQAGLERGLVMAFGLKEAVVVPAARDAASVSALVGYAAGLWLSDNLTDNMSLAVGWGQTLHLALRGMQPRQVEAMSVVSLLGGLTHSRSINPSAIGAPVADMFERLLPIDRAGLRLECRNPRCALARADPGPARPGAGGRYRAGPSAISSRIRRCSVRSSCRNRIWQASKAGAVGDLVCHFIDAAGELVDHPGQPAYHGGEPGRSRTPACRDRGRRRLGTCDPRGLAGERSEGPDHG